MTEPHPDRLEEAMAADQVPAPPADLVDRTVAAMLDADLAAGRADPARLVGRRRRWPMAAALATLLAGASLLTWQLRGPGVSAGERQLVVQETIRLGQRAVLVAEAGAQLRWRPGPASTVEVEQAAGAVFYRVNGGGFVVHTPAGVVRVAGTCFRVEVSDMKLVNRQNLSGAAVGAALGAAAVVTVYEGRVLLANSPSKGPHGEIELAPGQVGRVTADRAPNRLAPSETTSGAAARTGIPRFDDSEALRARIAEQDKELAQLRGTPPAPKKAGGTRQFLNPSREELLARVERCELAYDTPSINGFSEKDAQKMGLGETEREAMNEAIKETKEQAVSELRRLYIEMSGDAATAERLSPPAMETEIFARAVDGARVQARQQLARERAGLVSPPADLAKTPVAERTIRLMSNIGNLFEQKLAERLGAQRARALRSLEDGWTGKTITNGCH